METSTHRELGGFLRAHRASLAPGEVGLSPGSTRRTPGLRREEVATLSGVSLAWYTWLEQGRVATSRQVLDAVCRALLMDDTQHRHALELAGFSGRTEGGESTHLPDLIEAWPATPALLLDARLDILGGNAAYRRVWGDPTAIAAARRNLLLVITSVPWAVQYRDGGRELVLDLLGRFRENADHHPDDGRSVEVLRLLAAERPELAHWWACRAVRGVTPRTLEVHHPGGETLTLTFALLRPDHSHAALLLTATPVDTHSHTLLDGGSPGGEA